MPDRFGSLDMAKGPKNQYRPEDPVTAAAAVVRIATGQSDEETETTIALAEAKLRHEPLQRQQKTKSKPPHTR